MGYWCSRICYEKGADIVVDPDDWEKAGLAFAVKRASEIYHEVNKDCLLDWTDEEFERLVTAAIDGWIEWTQGGSNEAV
jgi:hypothetical protein